MAPLQKLIRQNSGNLFERNGHFRFVELGKTDAQKQTDDFTVLKKMIVANEAMYPNIERWFDTKVVPGLRSSERIAWIAYEDGNAVASAIMKLGKRSKFCHLHIHQNFRDQDLGQMFFTQMTLEARHRAEEIHFTLPESLWCEKSKFFESFGFSSAEKSLRQYRCGDTELSCSAPVKTVWSAALKRLPRLMSRFSISGYSLNHDIVMSIKPRLVERILAGTKLMEIRKRFSDRWVGGRVVLYASSPQKALVGEATIQSVTKGPPADIWEKFETSIGCSSDEYYTYVGSATMVNAIELAAVIPYVAPISLIQVSHLVQEDLIPPQSFCDLRLDDDESVWAKAVSVASLLHGRFSALSGTSR